MKDLTLQLPDDLESELAELSRRERRPAGDVALDLLIGSLQARRFQQLRRETLDALGPDAPPTDAEAIDEST